MHATLGSVCPYKGRAPEPSVPRMPCCRPSTPSSPLHPLHPHNPSCLTASLHPVCHHRSPGRRRAPHPAPCRTSHSCLALCPTLLARLALAQPRAAAAPAPHTSPQCIALLLDLTWRSHACDILRRRQEPECHRPLLRPNSAAKVLLRCG
jgi:hypothetical protein